MLHLASNIKFIRELAGLGQLEFGALFDINKDKVYNLENNRGKRDSIVIAKIATFAGIAEEDLYSKKLTIKDVDEAALKRRIAARPKAKKEPSPNNDEGLKDKYIALLEQRNQEMERRLTELEAARPSTLADIESRLQTIREEMKILISLSIAYSRRALELQAQDKKKFLQESRTIQKNVIANPGQFLTADTEAAAGTSDN